MMANSFWYNTYIYLIFDYCFSGINIDFVYYWIKTILYIIVIHMCTFTELQFVNTYILIRAKFSLTVNDVWMVTDLYLVVNIIVIGLELAVNDRGYSQICTLCLLVLLRIHKYPATSGLLSSYMFSDLNWSDELSLFNWFL